MLALVGALVAWVLFLRVFRSPVFLTIPIVEYTDPHFPPNSLAEQDSDALLQCFEEGKRTKAFDNQQRDLLEKKLAEIRSLPDPAVVVHLSALARSKDGELFVLPADADADDPSTWLPFRTVLQSLQQCQARHKLLLLDVMRPLADPRLGVLRHDVVRLLDQAVQSQPDPNLWVFCACSPGQVSLVSEDARQSVFGYYLKEGLSGWADGYGSSGKANGRVSVQELVDFVTAHVKHWAHRNRDRDQTPLLLAKGKDFALAVAKNDEPPTASETEEKYLPQLQNGWKLRDDWLANGSSRVAPRAFRRLEDLLLRTEQRWRGGIDPGRLGQSLTVEIKNFQQEVERARILKHPRPYSLAALDKRLPDDQDVAALKALAGEAEKAEKAKEPAAVKEQLRAKVEKLQQKFKDKPFELNRAVFQAAVDTPRPQAIRFLLTLLPAKRSQYAEILFLQRLAEFPADKGAQLDGSVRHLLQIVSEGEKAEACEPSALPGVQSQLEAAVAQRRQGLVLLFTGGEDSLAQATTLLEQAGKKYTAINRECEILREAQRLADEAMAFLPAFLPYLTNRPAVPLSEERIWIDAVTSARRLQELLAAASGHLPIPEGDLHAKLAELSQESETLRMQLEELHRPFAEETVKRLCTQSADHSASPALVVEIEARLSTPLLKAGDRLALWKAGRNLAQRLHSETVKLDHVERQPQQQFSALPRVESNDRDRTEDERPKRSARLSIALLHLGGLAGAKELEEELDRTMHTPTEAAWNSLADKLQHAWARKVPARLGELLARDDLRGADRLSRVVSPIDRDAGASAGEAGRNPAAELRRRQAKELWKWLGKRYRDEARSFPNSPVWAEFYGRAADEYLQFSE
jgi:hypothetical protein